jgi:cytosine deaminase
MSNRDDHDLARQRLAALASLPDAAVPWQGYLLGYRPSPDHADDACAWLACALALEGIAAGNFGIGAIVVDDAGRVAARGHNEIFHPHFRSDRHAEMVTMDRWEDATPTPVGGTLYTSVEPCPMCLVRLSGSGVRRVLHVAPDPAGGMVHRIESLPPYWSEMARVKVFGQARCSAELIHAAGRIFLVNLDELTARMKSL